jgi:uncharacterized protein
MSVILSINDRIIILSNNIDGRWIAAMNNFSLSNCRGELVNKQNLKHFIGEKLAEAFNSTIECLSQTEHKPTYDKLPFHHLIFNTTYKCNLSCKYCYFSADSSGSSLNEDLIEYSIRKCLDFLDDNSELTVLFQGGEALLEYDSIRNALEKLGKQPKIHYQMQTNGTLINEDAMNLFEKYNMHVSFSLDSHMENHNDLRSKNPNIFLQKIFDACKMFQERNLDYGIISVVCKNNINDLRFMFQEFIKRGIHTFAYNLLWPIGRAKNEGLDKLVVPTGQLVDTMLNVYKDIYKFNIDQGHAPFEKYHERNLFMLWRRLFYRKLTNYMCMNTPCGAGINTLTVDTDGQVFPCALMLPPLEKGFQIGNIYTDSISSLLQKDSLVKHRNLEQISQCSTCTYRAACAGGGCGIAFYHLKKDINAISIYCDYYYEMLSAMIEHAMLQMGIQVLKNFEG